MANADTLTPEAREARRKYKAKWNREHPEAQKRYTAAYWERKAKEAAEADSEKES